MAYLTESDLRRGFHKSASYVQRSLNSYSQPVDVFLSHSHKDADIVNAVIEHLAQYGLKVYVDWKDQTLPETTSVATADSIKQTIGRAKKFVLLATENSLVSRWVPWELGIADTLKGYDSVGILPVKRTASFPGNEYLQLYSVIEGVDGGGLIIKSPKVYGSKNLNEWAR